jgi:ABC-type oligopeptide transport system substrate-binding subunit
MFCKPAEEKIISRTRRRRIVSCFARWDIFPRVTFRNRLRSLLAPSHLSVRLALSLALITTLISSGCFLDNPVEPYYGRVVVPQSQVFRWSDGGLPQTFDPAFAAAPPDTDAVRAMFEGLTDYDPQTLAPVPAVASSWKSSADGREWTFNLRHDARWSNGEAVTAKDFVRSWRRIIELGERAPHIRLMENIDGVRVTLARSIPPALTPTPSNETSPKSVAGEANQLQKKSSVAEKTVTSFGAEALDDYTLRVRLQRPDLNFPALVAHPLFRPVHEESQTNSGVSENANPVSNGAFRLLKAAGDGVVLQRAENYWDTQAIKLQRVQFIPSRDAEAALAAYRDGQVDAVTNAGVEPLGLKLLTPYKDFRRTTFGALTYYSFNVARQPFDDVRVRQALAYAIDRDRISDDEMGGATEAAEKFLPVAANNAETSEVHNANSSDADNAPPLKHDRLLAQRLFAEAGFEGGKNFPRLRLLVNRNDLQRQVAQSVAAQWKSVLGVETEIIIKSWDEYETALRAGDYDVVRRGMVMQTTDEAANMRVMFEPDTQSNSIAQSLTGASAVINDPAERSATPRAAETRPAPPAATSNGEQRFAAPQVLSEAQALREVPAVPLYFASSYALVKPYVVGFDGNLLDAPSLKRVRIDTAWQTPPSKTALVTWYRAGKSTE